MTSVARVSRDPAATLEFEPAPTFRPGVLQDDGHLAESAHQRIGILIVAYNAVATLVPVLKRITPNVWRNVEEVVVFDDASQDATYELAVGLKTLRDLPKLKVLRHDKNLGYGGNQKAGYRYFIERGFDVVVLLHGDGQYAPEILAHMYEPIVSGRADAVFGSRMLRTYGGPLKGGMPLYKYVGNRILTLYENWALGLSLTEFHSGYRAYSLAALRQIDMSLMTNDFHFDTEIIIKLHHQGFRIREIAIPTYYGKEICNVDGLKYAKNVVTAVQRYDRTRRSVSKAPEFREYFVHYPIKRMKYSSHDYARRLVGANADVLDIGCGDGELAEQLRDNGNRVTGIDVQPEPKRPAAFANYISCNLDGGLEDVVAKLDGRQFDRILLLDILEHVRNPEQILKQCRQMLRPNGVLIVSLPNVANVTVRLSLLFGRFNYTERGILDRTHLWFFTARTAHNLVASSGWRVVKRLNTVIPVELIPGLSANQWILKMLNRLVGAATWCFPGLLGYQVMLVAQPDDRDLR